MDLTIDGRKNQFEQDAALYTSGDSAAYALEIIEFGIEPAQNVEVSVLSVDRGPQGSRTMILEYTLSAQSSAALSEAVNYIDTKASTGAVFQFTDGAREWPFVTNAEISSALVDEGATDEGALDLLDETEGAEESSGLWRIGVFVTVCVAVCFGVAILIYRVKRCNPCKRKVVGFDHVAAEMTVVPAVEEVVQPQGTKKLVSEDV